MVEPAAEWSLVRFHGRTADVFAPADPVGIAIFLHGYDSATWWRNPAYTAALTRARLAAICPHAPGTGWLPAVYPPFDPERTALDFVRTEVKGFIAERWGFGPPQLALAGIELGGQGALQLAYRYPQDFPIVVAISPKIDVHRWHGHGLTIDEIFPTAEAARQATVTLYLNPLNWPRRQLLLCDPADPYAFEGTDVLATKLSSSGVMHDRDLETSHGGFGWPYANAMATTVVDYLANGIRAELNRVP